jgi:hypothetical protein
MCVTKLVMPLLPCSSFCCRREAVFAVSAKYVLGGVLSTRLGYVTGQVLPAQLGCAWLTVHPD